jgi:hypothetical protein
MSTTSSPTSASSVSDFLFGNSPPATVTTYGSSTTAIPQWLQDYSQGIISQASTLAAQPAPVYGGPEVAGTTGMQQQSYDTLAGADASAPGSVTGAASPYMSQAGSYVNQALQPGQFGSTAAAPYMAQADQTFNNPNTVNSYMSPYLNDVIQANQTASNTNLQQNVIPQVESQFVGNGQQGGGGGVGGGGAFGTALGQQLDVTQQNLNAQDLAALESGYTTASSNFQSDTARQGTLGQLSGTLATEGQGALLQGGSQEGALGSTAGTLAAGDTSNAIQAANALGTAGTQQQTTNQQNLNASYNNWLQQTEYPYQMTQYEAGLAGEVPYGTSNINSAQTPYGSSTVSPYTQALQVLGVNGTTGLSQIGNLFGNTTSNPVSGVNGGADSSTATAGTVPSDVAADNAATLATNPIDPSSALSNISSQYFTFARGGQVPFRLGAAPRRTGRIAKGQRDELHRIYRGGLR